MRTTRTLVSGLAIVTAFLLSAAEGDSKQTAADEIAWGKSVQVSGKVVSVQAWPMEGVSTSHTLVKLQGDDGELDVVDLGPEANLKAKGIAPRDGQMLYVNGRVGKLNDKPMVVAETISESKLISVERQMALKPEKSDGHTAADHKKLTDAQDSEENCYHLVEGRLTGTRTIKFENSPVEHLFARVKTDSGMVVVDLGSKENLPKVDLTEGQSIVAAGFVCRLNGKPFIRAHAVGNMNPVKRQDVSAAVPKP